MMRRVAICLLVVTGAALVFGRAARTDGQAHSLQVDPVLNAAVGPDFTISLTDVGGAAVTQIPAGPYDLAWPRPGTVLAFSGLWF